MKNNRIGHYDEIKSRLTLERQLEEYTGRQGRRCPLICCCPQLRNISDRALRTKLEVCLQSYRDCNFYQMAR